ncbi:MAG: hypothetical protein JNL70_21100 [Saprospiraceae bacterium]|nr:hypothetical protein [Saprospiraceae bacterium]
MIDTQGLIIESTDTIFSTFPKRHRPVMEWSYFFDSLFDTLLSMSLQSDELYLPRIQSITNSVFGLYDCSFLKVKWCDNQDIIVWNIVDNSEDMTNIQQLQQYLNDIRLSNQQE